jgi:hypothetical protein
MQCHCFLRNLGGGKNAAFSSEMMSEEKEENKVLFVFVCAISKMMVNAKLSSPKKHSQFLQYMHYLQSFLQIFLMFVSHPSSCLLISPMCDYFGKLGPLKLGDFVM